ncbi:MAG TPA: hypothetical protein VFX59_22750 [Polyangiales bacterium]|nr:hypothetical protein [Polyangiales bacterium]
MDAETNTGDRKSSERDDIRAWVDEFAYDVNKRAVAHETSADFHRSRSVLFGAGATLASAISGVAMFLIAANQLRPGFEGGWTYAIGVLALLPPVLLGMHANLRDAERAQAHRTASAGYYRLKQKLELLHSESRWRDPLSTRDERTKLVDERELVFAGSITVSDDALRRAEKRLRLDQRVRKLPAAEAKAALAEASHDERSGILAALWFPLAFIGGATFLARSPEPLNVRIATLLIATGVGMAIVGLTPRALAKLKKLGATRHGLARFIPSQIGVGVLLVLIGELLLFPTDEIAIAAAAWIIVEQIWRRLGTGSTVRTLITPPPALPAPKPEGEVVAAPAS